MSRASKLTLLGTSTFAVATVIFVHFQQQAEKTAMHAGVIRDMEQQRLKKERQLDFDMQKQLEESYKKVQTVHDSVPPLVPMEQKPEPPRAGDVGGPSLK